MKKNRKRNQKRLFLIAIACINKLVLFVKKWGPDVFNLILSNLEHISDFDRWLRKSGPYENNRFMNGKLWLKLIFSRKMVLLILDEVKEKSKKLSHAKQAMIVFVCLICLTAMTFQGLAVGVVVASTYISNQPNQEHLKVTASADQLPQSETTLDTVVRKKVNPKVRKKSLGLSRVNATDADLKLREQRYVDAQKVNILKTDPRRAAPERIIGYNDLIVSAAKKHRLPNWQMLEAQLLAENHGKATGTSPTGPKGIAQFARARGFEAGLVMDKNYDQRLIPKYAIPAAAWAIRDAYDYYGDWDLAVVEYHMGRGALTKLIHMYLKPKPVTGKMKEIVKRYNLKYRDIFFRNTLYQNPGTNKMLRKLTKKDWSPRYLYKVKSWMQLMELYRTDRAQFVKLSKNSFYKKRAKKYAFWTYLNVMKDPSFKTIKDIKRGIADGDLIRLPDGNRYGYTLRKMGGSDPVKANRKYYRYTYRFTAGAAMYLGHALQQLRQSKGGSGGWYDISSLTRTERYQRLISKNRFATKDKSLHHFGVAFDIPYSSLSASEKSELKFLLEDLFESNMISFAPESGNCFHVVVAPNREARDFFTDYYRDVVGEQSLKKKIADEVTPKASPTPTELVAEIASGSAGAEIEAPIPTITVTPSPSATPTPMDSTDPTPAQSPKKPMKKRSDQPRSKDSNSNSSQSNSRDPFVN